MARKRGGLAGFYDRNKSWIKPVATLAAGALTGGTGGAIVGGLMSGLDREGKRGIGFDLKRGAIGAAQGYGMGKVGAGLKTGVMNRLGASAAGQSLGTGAAPANALMSASKSVSMPVSGVGNVSLATAPARDFMAESALRAVGSGVSDGGSMLGSLMRDGKTIKAIGDTAIGGYNAVQQNRMMQMERDQMNRRNRLEDEQLERTRAMDPVRAQLLAAMFQRLGLGGVA